MQKFDVTLFMTVAVASDALHEFGAATHTIETDNQTEACLSFDDKDGFTWRLHMEFAFGDLLLRLTTPNGEREVRGRREAAESENDHVARLVAAIMA